MRVVSVATASGLLVAGCCPCLVDDNFRAEADPVVEIAAFQSDDCVIRFETASADISADQQDSLSRCAGYFTQYPQVKLVIEGHADERGSDDYNKALGWQRAESVKRAMVERGVADARIKTRTEGEEEPVAEGHGESDWSQNRRVEMTTG